MYLITKRGVINLKFRTQQNKFKFRFVEWQALDWIKGVAMDEIFHLFMETTQQTHVKTKTYGCTK